MFSLKQEFGKFTVFSGDSLNGVTDSIRAKKQIQWIHVRHEETAAFAAGVEAHLTGPLAICAWELRPRGDRARQAKP